MKLRAIKASLAPIHAVGFGGSELATNIELVTVGYHSNKVLLFVAMVKGLYESRKKVAAFYQ